MAVPEHVRPDLVVDFDCFNPAPVLKDVQVEWNNLKKLVPGGILWTPRNGGHWIVLKAEEIRAVQTDFERFSSSEIIIPPDLEHKGIPLYPIDFDPPVQKPYRRAIMSELLPNRLALLEDKARELTIRLIEEMKPRKHCDFIKELSSIVPVTVFLEMMLLPLSDRDLLLSFAIAVMGGVTAEEHAWGHQGMEKYIRAKVIERKQNLGDDFMSKLITADIDGRQATEEEAISMVHLLVLGGLDTVSNMMSFFIYFLARNPGHRQQLIDEPDLIPAATEELMRRHGITSIARQVAKDTELGGAQLKKGDMVQIPNMLYGLDEALVDDPLSVDFRRESCPHATFGNGPHICVGQHLARRELKVLLEEWLKRIPDFQVRQGTTPVLRSGIVSGLHSLELEWS